MATVYTYSAMTDHDSFKCLCSNDNWGDATDKAAASEEKIMQLAQLMYDDGVMIDYLQSHRVIFMDDNGDWDALCCTDVPQTDEPDVYRLYTGFIGSDLMFADESNDCDSLIEKYNFALRNAYKIMALIDEDEADRCASEFRGIIIKTNDRDFAHVL